MNIPPLEINKHLRLFTEFDYVKRMFDYLEENPRACAFDYETSKVKPQRISDSKIYCMSIAFDDISCAFPYQYPKVTGEFPLRPLDTHWGSDKFLKVRELIVRFLKNHKISKIAQGSSFEGLWSYFLFETDVANMAWCTMQNTHILDTRKDFTGLKDQAFFRWGITNYEKEFKKFLPKDKSGNALNNVHKMPLMKLLKYCATDSFLTKKLALEQKDTFDLRSNKSMHTARKLFLATSKAFMDCQKTGVHIDVPYYKKQSESLIKQAGDIRKKIFSSEVARRFVDIKGHEMNLNSTADLRFFLFNLLEEESWKETATGLKSVDKDVLKSLKSSVGKSIVKMRECEKLSNTYIAQYLREEVDGKIYPFIHTHFARSGRSSSSMPNLQNVPKRNKKAKKLIRRGIIPSPGNKLAEIDFSSIEVRIIGCESMDKVLLEYLNDPTTDMHYDQGKELFMLGDSDMNKSLRYNAKSDFVFLEFYGGDAASSARYLWNDSIDLKIGKDEDGPTLFHHLQDNNIYCLEEFVEHVEEVEKRLWKKYVGVKAWQQKQKQFYLDNGFVETHFGFRRGGYLKWNVILNTRIQSTAAHLLWWCFILINNARKEEDWKTKLLLQIHDSVFADVYPEEEEHFFATCHKIMTQDTVKAFKWIKVPIEIEIEAGGINESWNEIKEISPEYYNKIKALIAGS